MIGSCSPSRSRLFYFGGGGGSLTIGESESPSGYNLIIDLLSQYGVPIGRNKKNGSYG